MKDWLVCIFLIIQSINCSGQKQIIDASVFDNWFNVENPAISSDGKYVFYNVNNLPKGGHTLVVQKTDNKWKKEIVGATGAIFSMDSKRIIYKSNDDTLFLLYLGTDHFELYPNVEKYQISREGKKEWLAIKIKDQNKELRLYDLTSGRKQSFFNVGDYILSNNGKLLILTEDISGQQQKNTLQLTNLVTGESRMVWQSDIRSEEHTRIINFAFDAEGKQVVFLVTKQNNGQSIKSIWYYKEAMKFAEEVLSSQSTVIPKGYEILGGKFSADGKRLYFDLNIPSKSLPGTKANGVKVDIWSYNDDKLQSQQLQESVKSVLCKGVMLTEDKNAFLLQTENERWYDRRNSNDYMLLTRSICYREENNWRPSCREPLCLINIKTGSKQLIKDGLLYSELNSFSPDGEYVLFYDYEQQNYFSYNIKDGNTVNISNKIPFPIYDNAHARAGQPKPYSELPNTWVANKGLILYDEFDIWLVDPAGINSPVCLTNGYGRRNQVILRLSETNRIITEKEILLIAFRPSDKANGFYRLSLNNVEDPKELSMQPDLYWWPDLEKYQVNEIGMQPIKASNTNMWLVQRMSATEAPNYFVTKDFKSFRPLSNIQPQSNYNWLTSELFEWKLFDGTISQGILYKPENFDPHKKYPVIFHFYEERSNGLHSYMRPETSNSKINIPHFVSNGYLVFVPDVYYPIGSPADGVYNSLVTAAEYIAKLSFVDSTKMGLQGHSWGGYAVNALITKSNLFAAAAEAAGPTDFVSGYGSILKKGNSNQFQYETGQSRIKATLWQSPDLYTSNSPVFYADKVRTPLLIMHCKDDNAVPFEQGLEWFTALRRLNKPAWMLQYDKGGHQLGGDEAMDYTIRLTQFFNHYLKSAPPPIWMSRGIPARLKGIETGYELDPNGTCGKDCKVCKMWNEKMKKDSVGTMQEIEKRKMEEHWQ